ncbi:MAG TPA: translation elongation factor Ts [Fimbriimonas sp.]|nr:translation elongation factor Ts [Fimbriimonas sp.]
MANYTAADVKKLREETDAPMMECKTALDEADGNYDRAKEILREKGKAAAAKRVDRSTAAGVVAFATNEGATKLGGVVVECETDFVARNEDFIAIAQQVAEIVLNSGENDPKIKELLEGAVAKIRENIRLAKAVSLSTSGKFLTYVHHDKTKGAAVEVSGASNDEAVRKIAIQAVAFPPEVLNRADLSQASIDKEIEVETKRAIEEGKPENIAANIAKGRVNKEFITKVVLMEQLYYADQSKSVSQYLAESAKGSKVESFVYLAVGQNG